MQLLDPSELFGQVVARRLTVVGKLTIASYNNMEYSKQAKLKFVRSPHDKTFYDDMLSVSLDPAERGNFKGGYIEGIVLNGIDSAPFTSSWEDWVIPEKFRSVGKWETLAVEKLLEEVDFMDKKVNVAEKPPSESFNEDTKEETYPRHTITIV